MAPRFVPRERKHKRLAKQKQHHGNGENSNAQEIIPASQSEKEARRSALQQEIRDAQTSHVSSKKRKRLDKYIDTKLRREENLELLKKLSEHKVDTSLLQSSKKLGRVHESKRERLQRALRERNAGLNEGKAEKVLFQARPDLHQYNDDRLEDESDEGAEEDEVGGALVVPEVTHKQNFGSGLKRPLETDDSGHVVIKKRKRQKKGGASSLNLALDSVPGEENVEVVSEDNVTTEEEGEDDEEWAGFESDVESVSVDRGVSESPEGSDEDDSASDNESASESSSSDSTPGTSASEGKPARVSAFKAWADSQRNASLGFTPSIAPTNSDMAIKANFKARALSPDPYLQPSSTSTGPSLRPAAAITIPRTDAVQTARMQLPVVQEEQRIMETIDNNPVVLVSGATGSGKTTQIPQMLFENGYSSRGLIGVTQPRRVAATSVADRVAYELGPAYRDRVAHQVRHDTNVSHSTAIKFMTDGILLREIQQDFPLSKYSVVVLDEAHERSVNTDLLIGMLSRIVDLRTELAKEQPDRYSPLKLIIMSATLRTSDFISNSRLWRNGTPPVVEAEGRQFPVTVHFSKRTERDWLAEMVEKVARGHKKLPPGAMLVFLTGRQEIQTVMKRLRQRLGGKAGYAGGVMTDVEDFDESSPGPRGHDNYLEGEDDPSDVDSDAEIRVEDDDAEFAIEEDQSSPRGVLQTYILPLYAALPISQQLKVFQPPPKGSRLIVLATNVAETSLTIPDVRYVFDSGRSKEKTYDSSTGVQKFEIDWVSKASASQRTGRAGRTGPGHCYRLYSSAVYERFFAEHAIPEILRTPLESVVLQLKAMGVENVANFPFPTAPEREQILGAERLLGLLGAVDERRGSITDLGKEVAGHPVSPRFGKMLSLALKNGVIAHTIGLVAALAVGDVFIPEAHFGEDGRGNDRREDESDSDEEKAATFEAKAASTASEHRHQAYNRAHATLSKWDDRSDAIKILTAVAAHADARDTTRFCDDFFLREKGMMEIQQLRQQLHSILSAASQDHQPAGMFTAFKLLLPLPSDKERAMLNQVVAAGFIDQVAIRADALSDSTTAASFGRKPRRAIEVPYRTLMPSSTPTDHMASAAEQDVERSVFVHPSSVLARLSVKEMPRYVVYSHLSRAAAETVDGKRKKTRVHPLTAIGPKALAVLAEGTPLLEVGKPVGKIEELPEKKRRCWVGIGLRAPGGSGVGWPLGAWKVLQRRVNGEWEIEQVFAR